MMQIKKGLPEESDIVLCTVTKIYPHCVFTTLDEYGKQGMIHISEISPGRIRNIHDYVKIDKKIVCKVLRVDLEKGHIDLSLRRVSEGQRREKANLLKQDQKAEKIIDFVAKKLKLNTKELYDKIWAKTKDEYHTIHSFFEDFISDEKIIKDLELSPEVTKKLAETIHQRIKPPEIKIQGDLVLKSYAPDGVEIIKKALIAAGKNSDVDIRYKGAGKYSLVIVGEDYKDAEKVMEEAYSKAIDIVKKNNGEGSFIRIETK